MSTSAKYSLGLDEFNSKKYLLWKSVIAEFIGNFILNFFSSAACTQHEDGLFKSLSFGLGVYIAISIIRHLSGGHVNPAVTLAMLCTGRISLIRSFFYVIAQCLGSGVGTSIAKAFLDVAYHNGLAHVTLAENITELQGLGIEFCLGLMLILTVYGVCDVNRTDQRCTAPFEIGMCVTLGHLGTMRYTGCGMNPARTFGTAYVTNNWDSHWIYWVGPIFGGIVAAIMYTYILEKPVENPKPTEASNKYRIYAYERELKQLDNPNNYI